MKIVSIVGARPQFIKLAPVSKEIRKYHDEIIVHTGQHYDRELSDAFFNQLRIPKPDYNLGIGSGSHAYQTGHMLIEIEKVLIYEKPDFVLIFGDTNSTVSASLASSKLHYPVGHIEAGVRNFNLRIAEEINRVVADHISTLLFAPTQTAVDNLKKEGFEDNVFLTGDVMYDSLLNNIQIALEESRILEKLHLEEKNYILATIHRAENTDNSENLINIFSAFLETDENIVIPLHPRTVKELKNNSFNFGNSKNLLVIKPLEYIDFLNLMYNAKKIVTDSGGIQKEAYLLKIPCITIFDSTSWVETLHDGWNVLVEPLKENIIDRICKFDPRGDQGNHFGDGRASVKIIDIINKFFRVARE